MSSPSEQNKYPYGYGLSKVTLIKLYMNRANVQRWSLVLGLAPFLILYPWSLFRENVLNNESYKFLDSFMVALGFLVWGFLGLFWAYREQIPQIVTVKGKPALVMGTIMMVISWTISIYSFVNGMSLMIKHVR